jgi:hypothetical protein
VGKTTSVMVDSETYDGAREKEDAKDCVDVCPLKK